MLLLTLFLIYLVGAIAIGVPIAFALLFCSVATGMHMGGTATNPAIISQQLLRGTDSVSMMALPFFVLAGELMNRGGLTPASSPSSTSLSAASAVVWDT